MKFLARAMAAALAAISILLTVACGYQVAGTATRLPPDIKTIAIPVFTNKSTRFRIEQRVSAAVTREFIDRTSYRITPNPAGADAELKGTITAVHSGVLTFDPNTGRATTFQIQVTANVQLIDLHSKKVVFSNPNYIFREQYQVSQSTTALYEESEPALNRLSQDFARTLVTDILENF
jgi:outer membrane lipopolysaccharide assembly protein LptE/RlpB